MPADRLLVLLRHGQSEWNLKNLFTGWRDVDLSPAGVEEAKEAGRRMKAHGNCFRPRLHLSPHPRPADAALALAEMGLTGRAGRARSGSQRARLRRSCWPQQGRCAQEMGRGAGPHLAAQLRHQSARRRKPEGYGGAGASLLLPEHPSPRARRQARAGRGARQHLCARWSWCSTGSRPKRFPRWSSRPACPSSIGSTPTRPSPARRS